MKDKGYWRGCCWLWLAALLLVGGGCRNHRWPEELTVGAWNVEHLGAPERRFAPATGVARDPRALADYILASDAVLIAFQEIYRTGEGPTNTTLAAALDLVAGDGGPRWEHRLFLTGNHQWQLCGIAWNTAVLEAVGEPFAVPIEGPAKSAQGKTIWYRKPHAMKFSTGPGRTDFVVIPVHMKSDYGGDFGAHRAAEAAALIAALPAVREHFADRDILIIGDTNCDQSLDAAIQTFFAADYHDLNLEDAPTHVRYGALDRILVPADQPEFTARFRVFRDDYLRRRGWTAAAFQRALSDHFMVLTAIQVMPDDD